MSLISIHQSSAILPKSRVYSRTHMGQQLWRRSQGNSIDRSGSERGVARLWLDCDSCTTIFGQKSGGPEGKLHVLFGTRVRNPKREREISIVTPTRQHYRRRLWTLQFAITFAIWTEKNSLRVEVVQLKWHLNILFLKLKEHINRNLVIQVSF